MVNLTPSRDRELWLELSLREAQGQTLSRLDRAFLQKYEPPPPSLDDRLAALDRQIPPAPKPAIDDYELARRRIVRELALKRRWGRVPEKTRRIEAALHRKGY
jgi:hypothetical protein